jgi:hypothetical protein
MVYVLQKSQLYLHLVKFVTCQKIEKLLFRRIETIQ